MILSGLFTVNCLSHVLVNLNPRSPPLAARRPLFPALPAVVSVSPCLWLLALSFTFRVPPVLCERSPLPSRPPISAGVSYWWESSAKGHRCSLACCVPLCTSLTLSSSPRRNHPLRSEPLLPRLRGSWRGPSIIVRYPLAGDTKTSDHFATKATAKDHIKHLKSKSRKVIVSEDKRAALKVWGFFGLLCPFVFAGAKWRPQGKL